MANLPYPLQSQTLEELRAQILDMFRDLYEIRIGGSLIGDVFRVSSDVLEIKLRTGSGLKKTNGELDFDLAAIVAPAAAVMQSAYTAKGGIMSASASGTISYVTVGTDGQVLKADSTKTAGLAWLTLTAALVGLGTSDNVQFASVRAVHKSSDNTAGLASGTVTYAKDGGGTGTITIKDGLITAIT